VVSTAVATVPTGARAQSESEPPPLSKLPKLEADAQPAYPDLALRDRVSARVTLELTITATGTVDDVRVIETSTSAEVQPDGTTLVGPDSPSDYGFGEAAVAAMKKFRFEPAEADGEPVPVTTTYTFNFSLPPPEPPDAPTTETPTATRGVENFVGTLRERGTRKAIPGAIVTVFRLGETEEEEDVGFEAVSDENGTFRFYGLPPGPWKVLVEADGYFPVRTTERIVRGQVTEVRYFLERGTYSTYDILVEGDRVVKEVNRRVITAEEAYSVPGALGDPVAVVRNLPGVARPAVGAGAVPVRGSAPADTGYLVEGIEIPFIFHFGSQRSVIPAELIESVVFIPGNFSVYYGRRTGGILDVQLKELDPDQVHGAAQASILDANGYVEVPITDELSIAGGFRGSYVDAIVEGVVGEDSSVDVIAAPAYLDYQILADWEPGAAHDFRFFFFGSQDELRLLFEDAQQASVQLTSGAVQNTTRFNRAILQYDFKPNEIFSNEFQVAFGVDQISAAAFDIFEFELDNLQWQIRNRSRYHFSERFFLDVGVDGLIRLSDIDVIAPNPNQDPQNPDFNDLVATSLTNEFAAQIAPYIEAEIDVTDRLTLIPGVRFDYYSDAEDYSLDPRLIARYALDEDWTIKSGVGIFHQPPQAQDLSEDFGNPELDIPRSIQTSAGVEWNPVDYFEADVTFFYKRLDRLVDDTDDFRTNENGELVPALLDNGRTGDVVGLEVYLKHDFHENFQGWLSYTLSRATRVDSGETRERLFDFDQTHILAAVLSYRFPENWELTTRFRLVSGNPFTPIEGGVYLDSQDDYAPLEAPRNSDRLPAFHQWDLRLDKRWVFDYFSIAAFLEVLNVYNRGNVEGFSYNFDFSERSDVSGLPVIPNVGFRIDF